MTISIPTLDHRRADVGAHDPDNRPLYTIHSNRTRLQIILDHATLHKLTAEQIHELVRLLPDDTPTAQIIPLHPAAGRERVAG